MKSLRKRAIAKACGKRFKASKNGGFVLHDQYGSVELLFKADNQYIMALIRS